ncbi:M81 family metallopeptidase [Paraburkholderia sp.]|uniref:M81 family metallopeptidase n=1 Tax=Paraburkholderia sp. TaxID=1926495 RepID=UPI0039E3B3FE
MRIVIAMMRHETNTFSPIQTHLKQFDRGTQQAGPAYGDDAIRACENTRSAAAAFIRIAREAGARIVMPILANAVPSGIVTDAAFESIARSIVEAVGEGCDAVLLDLHGAMVTESLADPEGELVRRIRDVAPDVPIGAALDFHANLSETFVRHVDAIAGYQTYPHVDIYETGERAARTLVAMLRGDAKPVVLWRALPMLTDMLRQTPAGQPMKDIVERAKAAERAGDVLNATVFGGFPLADVPHVALSIVVVADASRVAAARELVDELATMAWQRRADFIYPPESLDVSLDRAQRFDDGPVLLVDHGDNCGAGGPTDVMTVLREVLARGMRDVVAGPFWDPQTVDALFDAGVGATLTVDVGGRTDMPAIGLKGEPLRLTGRVRTLTDGTYTVTGPMFTGMRLSLGRTAVFEVDGSKIVVCEKPQEPFDAGVFTHANIDLEHCRTILIKSRQHFRAGFESIARHIVMVAGPGVCSSDYAAFPYRRLRRPIYPLDRETLAEAAIGWTPAVQG